MRITHGSHTDTGRRSNNEDALIAAPDLGFFAVADGMGGTEGGEVASALALDTLHRYFERVGDGLDLVSEPGAALAQMRMAIRMAHRAVQRAAVGSLRDMGTTVVCLLVRGERALVAHVGDSRVYLARDGELSQLTRDHSLVAAMEAAGMPASPELAHIITQAVGQGADAQPDLSIVDVQEGDRFLLATDGLTDALDDDAIRRGLSRSKDAARALATAAYEAGSRDNITALVVQAR